MTSATRRQFLSTAGATLALARASVLDAEPVKTLKVAAIFTEFTYRSHAYVILENFLEPYLFNGRRTIPGVEVVSFYSDQLPAQSSCKSRTSGRSTPPAGRCEIGWWSSRRASRTTTS